MSTYTVKLNNMEKVKHFVAIMNNFDGRAELIQQEYTINAKSILAIFALDLTSTLCLRIESDSLPSELKRYLA